ncbi:MAG: hypothetical protein GQ547_09135 [Methylophaga sp.]|nr:hypothetical protein [Methylophaga sp.]
MKRRLIFVLFSLFSTVLLAEQNIETIQLNHRLTTEVLPEIQAFLPKNATARAFNDYIILKASPAVLKEVKQLINQLDTPLQRLKISVLRTNEQLSNHASRQIGADIEISDDGASGHASVKTWSTHSVRNKDQHYQAQGIAGKPVIISLGQEIPQKEQDIVIFANGSIGVQSSTHYISIESGFQAVARILPNHQAIIDIHPRFSQLSKRNGMIETSDILTSIAGPVGTWIELGHIDNENNIEKQGATRYRSHRKRQQTIYIKVDPL